MSTDLARRIRLDVSSDNVTFLQVKGINDLNFPITPTKVDITTYDTNGWKDYIVTLQEWVGNIKCNRQSTAGVQDPGQLLLTGCVGKFDPLNRLYVRWYDNTGKPEPSFSGAAIVEQSQSKTGVADPDEDGFMFTGAGAATAITNPYAAAAVPVITAATPSGASVGQMVTISGQNFIGTVVTTGVKFNSVNATSWVVLSDTTIVAIMPAGSAGVGNIVVTNAAGASASFAYTRGA